MKKNFKKKKKKYHTTTTNNEFYYNQINIQALYIENININNLKINLWQGNTMKLSRGISFLFDQIYIRCEIEQLSLLKNQYNNKIAKYYQYIDLKQHKSPFQMSYKDNLQQDQFMLSEFYVSIYNQIFTIKNIIFNCLYSSCNLIFNDEEQLTKNLDNSRVVVHTYENQRFVLGRGWSSKNLLPTDRMAWTDKKGTLSIKKELVTLPSNEWEWETSWYIDYQLGNIDQYGWEYATDFPATFTIRGDAWYFSVRRRRWIRIRKLKTREYKGIKQQQLKQQTNHFIYQIKQIQFIQHTWNKIKYIQDQHFHILNKRALFKQTIDLLNKKASVTQSSDTQSFENDDDDEQIPILKRNSSLHEFFKIEQQVTKEEKIEPHVGQVEQQHVEQQQAKQAQQQQQVKQATNNHIQGLIHQKLSKTKIINIVYPKWSTYSYNSHHLHIIDCKFLITMEIKETFLSFIKQYKEIISSLYEQEVEKRELMELKRLEYVKKDPAVTITNHNHLQVLLDEHHDEIDDVNTTTSLTNELYDLWSSDDDSNDADIEDDDDDDDDLIDNEYKRPYIPSSSLDRKKSIYISQKRQEIIHVQLDNFQCNIYHKDLDANMLIYIKELSTDGFIHYVTNQQISCIKYTLCIYDINVYTIPTSIDIEQGLIWYNIANSSILHEIIQTFSCIIHIKQSLAYEFTIDIPLPSLIITLNTNEFSLLLHLIQIFTTSTTSKPDDEDEVIESDDNQDDNVEHNKTTVKQQTQLNDELIAQYKNMSILQLRRTLYYIKAQKRIEEWNVKHLLQMKTLNNDDIDDILPQVLLSYNSLAAKYTLIMNILKQRENNRFNQSKISLQIHLTLNEIVLHMTNLLSIELFQVFATQITCSLEILKDLSSDFFLEIYSFGGKYVQNEGNSAVAGKKKEKKEKLLKSKATDNPPKTTPAKKKMGTIVITFTI